MGYLYFRRVWKDRAEPSEPEQELELELELEDRSVEFNDKKEKKKEGARVGKERRKKGTKTFTAKTIAELEKVWNMR